MRRSPSTESRAKSDEIQSTSSTIKQETKKRADHTDHTTVSTSFCGCKKDKCDAFFDKLLNYLEKQSDIIAKCCAHSRELRRESIDKTGSSRELSPKPKQPSPCKDQPRPTSSEIHKPHQGKTKVRDKDCEKDSDETDSQQKTKPDCKKEDFYSKPSRYKSNLDLGCNQMKIRDRPCNIYVDVCSCQKLGKSNSSKRSPKIESESDEISFKQTSRTPLHHPSPKHSGYALECQGYEQKVSCFLKLADEICEGYMKHCKEQTDPSKGRSHVFDKKGPSREEVQHVVSKPSQLQQCSDDYCCDKPERDPCARPIAIEIECEGAKEQFIVEPCRCPSGGPRHREGPKRNCMDVFEERYGKTLRDLQAKLLDLSQSKPNQAPYGDQAPQPPPPQKQQPTQQSPPPVQHQPPPVHHQPPPVQHQPLPEQKKPSLQRSMQFMPENPRKHEAEPPKSTPKRDPTPSDDDSSDERRKPKKKENKKEKRMKKKSPGS